MQDVVVRAAEPTDAAAIAALAGALSYPTTAEEMTLRLSSLSSADAVLVAVSADTVVGWVHVAAVQSIQSGAFAEIHGLVVAESQRSRGIGALLVDASESWARARSLARIRVRSNITRDRTHAFYERLGYATRKTQKVFEKSV